MNITKDDTITKIISLKTGVVEYIILPLNISITRVIGFSFTPQIIFGFGSLNRIGVLSLFLKAKTAFIVTDKEIEKLGFSEKIQKYLEKSGIKSTVFNEVESNPSEETVMHGGEKLKASGADIVISVGGGSVIDAGKIIRLLSKQGGKPSDYDATKCTIMSIHETLAPQISIPTTSGTGSEVSIVAMVTKHDDKKEKITILGYPLMSSIALVDPQLTLSCPQKLTAWCGMDAMTHAIEAFISLKTNPVADMLALQAMALLYNYIKKAYSNGQDIISRINMSLASMVAGIAFNQKSVGLVHACSHQLSSQCNLHHGLANAMMLPHVLKVNKKASGAKYQTMATAFGIDILKLSESEAIEKFILEIENLNKELGIPGKLSECGVKESDIPIMAANAITDISAITNPLQPITRELVEDLYKAVL